MKSSLRTALFYLICILFVFCSAYILYTALFAKTALYETCQPAGSLYGSHEPYCVTFRAEPWLRGGYSAFIHSQGNADYGVNVPLFYTVSDSFVLHLEVYDDLLVTWREEGIAIHLENGIEMNIPKDMFIGGR